MREQIEAASEQLPLSRFFIENRTLSSGLNLKDYVEVQRFPNAANIYNSTLAIWDWSPCRTDKGGPVLPGH